MWGGRWRATSRFNPFITNEATRRHQKIWFYCWSFHTVTEEEKELYAQFKEVTFLGRKIAGLISAEVK